MNNLSYPRVAALSFAIIAFLGFLRLEANAAETGDISGTVTNSASGNLLQDARVEVLGTTVLTYTDELGRFIIRDLSPGDYTVQVYYTGLAVERQILKVEAGKKTESIFALSTEIYKLDAYIVTGEREGNAASITRQRTAPNIKNVVSLDAFGNLANDNAGELLIRLPGIIGNIDDEGNIDNVGVRGATAGMTVVSVDGNQMSSTGGFGRNFRTHTISAALFDEIEVTKASTPDMPGDSLGGSINLKTASTLRHKSRRIEYRLTGRWAAPFYENIPMLEQHPAHALFSLKYQDIFSVFGGKNNLGVAINAFYSENASGNYKSQLSYQYTQDYPAYIHDYQVTDTYNNRKQASANLRIDYRLAPGTTIYLGMIYNDAFEPGMQRLRAESYNSLAVASWNEAEQKWEGGPILPGYTNDRTEMRPGLVGFQSQQSMFTRFQMETIYSSFLARERQINLGAKHEWGRFALDYDANYNFSHVNMSDGKGKDQGGNLLVYLRGNRAIIDKSESSDYPKFESPYESGEANIYDISSWVNSRDNPVATLTSYDGKKRNTDIFTAKADVRYMPPTSFASSLKAGVRYRWQKVETLNGDHTWRYQTGNYQISELSEYVDPGLRTRIGEHYGQEYAYIDPRTIRSLIDTGDPRWAPDEGLNVRYYYQGTRDAEEDVFGGYMQGSARLGRLNLLGGVRYEETETKTFGHYQIPASGRPADYSTKSAAEKARIDYGNPASSSGSYDDFFPSMHATYSFTKNLLLRASWSNTIGRPSMGDLLPGVSMGADAITVNNPDLNPQRATNWDISFEYYFEPVGQFTIGVFRKEIDDFFVNSIVGTIGDMTNPAIATFMEKYPFLVDVVYQGVELRTKYNGDQARIDGLEVSYRQSLQFLPGFLKGLSFFANYTRLKTVTDYGEQEDSTNEVAGFTPDSANAGLTWKYKRWGARVMANYTGKALFSYNADKSRLIYRKARTQVNMALTYQFDRRLGVSLELWNAFNAPRRFYQYREDRPYQFVDIGTTVFIGINGTF